MNGSHPINWQAQVRCKQSQLDKTCDGFFFDANKQFRFFARKSPIVARMDFFSWTFWAPRRSCGVTSQVMLSWRDVSCKHCRLNHRCCSPCYTTEHSFTAFITMTFKVHIWIHQSSGRLECSSILWITSEEVLTKTGCQSIQGCWRCEGLKMCDQIRCFPIFSLSVTSEGRISPQNGFGLNRDLSSEFNGPT